MPDDADEEITSNVVRRLDAVIALLAQGKDMSVRQSIVTLSNAGLRPFEIARILGKEQATVRGEISRAKARRSGSTKEASDDKER